MKTLLLLLAFSTTLLAQEWRTEIKLLGGVSAADLDTGYIATSERVIGGGYMAGIEGAVNLNSILALTGQYVYNDLGSGIRLFCDAPACGRVIGDAAFHEYMGGVRLRGNSGGRVSPYIGASVGAVRLLASATIPTSRGSVLLQDSASKFAYSAGTGFDVKIVRHLAIGIDTRFVKATDLAWYLRAGLGLSLRF